MPRRPPRRRRVRRCRRGPGRPCAGARRRSRASARRSTGVGRARLEAAQVAASRFWRSCGVAARSAAPATHGQHRVGEQQQRRRRSGRSTAPAARRRRRRGASGGGAADWSPSWSSAQRRLRAAERPGPGVGQRAADRDVAGPGGLRGRRAQHDQDRRDGAARRPGSHSSQPRAVDVAARDEQDQRPRRLAGGRGPTAGVDVQRDDGASGTSPSSTSATRGRARRSATSGATCQQPQVRGGHQQRRRVRVADPDDQPRAADSTSGDRGGRPGAVGARRGRPKHAQPSGAGRATPSAKVRRSRATRRGRRASTGSRRGGRGRPAAPGSATPPAPARAANRGGDSERQRRRPAPTRSQRADGLAAAARAREAVDRRDEHRQHQRGDQQPDRPARQHLAPGDEVAPAARWRCRARWSSASMERSAARPKTPQPALGHGARRRPAGARRWPTAAPRGGRGAPNGPCSPRVSGTAWRAHCTVARGPPGSTPASPRTAVSTVRRSRSGAMPWPLEKPTTNGLRTLDARHVAEDEHGVDGPRERGDRRRAPRPRRRCRRSWRRR